MTPDRNPYLIFGSTENLAALKLLLILEEQIKNQPAVLQLIAAIDKRIEENNEGETITQKYL